MGLADYSVWDRVLSSKRKELDMMISTSLYGVFPKIQRLESESVFAFPRHAQPAPSIEMQECRKHAAELVGLPYATLSSSKRINMFDGGNYATMYLV